MGKVQAQEACVKALELDMVWVHGYGPDSQFVQDMAELERQYHGASYMWADAPDCRPHNCGGN